MVKTHYPDPTWFEKDRNGHAHQFQGDQLPTLKIIISGHRWCDECGESHDHNIYACVECGAAVEPRTTTKRPAPAKKKVTPAGKRDVFAVGGYKSGVLAISDIAIEAQRDDVEVSTFNSSAAREFLQGPPRYILSINNGEFNIELTEIEIQVASQAAKRGHKGMLEFADTILRDRGIIE